MREKLRLLMLTLLCVAFGQAMAQEVVLDFTTNDGWQLPVGNSNKGTTAASFTNGGYTITLQAESNGYYFSTNSSASYLMLGRLNATITLPAFDFDVATIEVVGNSAASANVQQNIFVGENAICTATTGANKTNKYDIPADYQAAGTIYTLKVLSNHNTQICKINVYKTGDTVKDTPTLSFDTTSFTAILGEDFDAPTLTYTGDGTVTYSSDNEEVATVNESTGVVDIIGVGVANITASASETANYNAVSASYKITVIEPQGTHDIVDGTFDFTDNTDYGTGLVPSSSTEEYITEDHTWTAGNVTLVTSGKYRWWFNGNGNTLRFYTNLVEEVQTSKMTISVPDGYTISQIAMTGSSLQFTANVGTYTNGNWTGEAQSVELAYDGTGTKQIKTIVVTYSNGDTPAEKETPTMKFSGTYYTVVLGDDFTIPELTYSGDGAVTYASDNTEVATVNETTGEVDIVGAGLAVITATAAETETYNSATASYTISVTEDQGTHEVVDGTFDFTDNTDYGTGLTPLSGDEYITQDYTWTAGNVTLVTSGKYRWWLNANGNTLRFYNNVVEEVQTSKMTISVPDGYTISQIAMTGSSLQFTANVGTYTNGNWTGEAQSVELAYDGTGTKQIKTIVVTYSNGDTPAEKETPTMKFSGSYYTVVLGDDFTIPELTYSGDGAVTYASDNTEVATVNETTGEVDIVGAGLAVITATAAETDTYKSATASYTISVTDDQGTHEVVDGTFDFTDNTDYGTGLTPLSSDEYITQDYTWTAGNVTLVTSGKYRWWLNAKGNTLRFYNNIVEEVQTSKMTIAVPDGYSISQIAMTGSSLQFTANVGEYTDGTWTGDAQSVEFTYDGTGTRQIKTITVTYSKTGDEILIGDANGDGEVSILDVTKVVDYILRNVTEGLNFDNADVDKNGALDINDISGIVNIIINN